MKISCLSLFFLISMFACASSGQSLSNSSRLSTLSGVKFPERIGWLDKTPSFNKNADIEIILLGPASAETVRPMITIKQLEISVRNQRVAPNEILKQHVQEHIQRYDAFSIIREPPDLAHLNQPSALVLAELNELQDDGTLFKSTVLDYLLYHQDKIWILHCLVHPAQVDEVHAWVRSIRLE